MRLIVVGAGPAGLCAAISAAQSGASVTVLERNEKAGKKLYLTGKGRCNVTNASDISEFFENIPRNPSFLYSALYTFTNLDLMALIEGEGVPLKTERGQRVFPESDKASDITRAFMQRARRAGVSFRFNTLVSGLIVENGAVCGVRTENGELRADGVVLACGGVSYTSTGSDGLGHKIAAGLGHRIEEMSGRLVGIVTHGDAAQRMQGLTAKNVRLTVRDGKKRLYTEMGELLFTHFGVSGPLVLSASSCMDRADGVTFEIDFKPALDDQTLEKRLRSDLEINLNRNVGNSLNALLPASFIPVALDEAGIDPTTKCCQLRREERAALCRVIKGFTLTAKQFRPVNEAIITRGGICVKEIDPSTMESRIVKGLYFAGEMIDVDAFTGGYNITIAASTGWLAGLNAAQQG